MAVLIAQNLAPVMFASLVAFLLLGYPVAFSLAACGLFYFVVGVELTPLSAGAINLAWPMLQTLPVRIVDIMSSQTLLAIPFFTLMGLILERSGMAEDLLDTVGHLFGTVRGGLAYAVIFVGALLAATTGVVAASVISMGLISLPIMLRYGYDRRVASGVIAASGTLAQIIPPSLVLIVMAEQLQKSVGEMYAAAFVPGLVLASLYAVYIFGLSRLYPETVPGLPAEALAFNEHEGPSYKQNAKFSGAVLQAVALYLAVFGAYALVRRNAAMGWPGGTMPLLAAAVAVLLGRYGGQVRASGRDPRGLASLTALAALAGAVGTTAVTMLTPAGPTAPAGSDFAVLCVGLSVAVALAIAAADWWSHRLTSRRLLSRMAARVTFVMVPPLFLIFLVLGTIFIGLATPTEGGAMGASGALALAAIKRRLDRNPARFNLAMLQSALEATAKLTAFAIFILVGTRIFSLTFYAVNGQRWVEQLLVSLPGGAIGFLIVVNALVFLLAFFLEFFELAFIVIPLLVAPAEALGIDLVWLGVILGVNMQTSFMHPPFGYALFYLRSVAPDQPYQDKVTGRETLGVTTGQIYSGAIPFVIIQCIMVGLVIGFPQLTLRGKQPTAAPIQNSQPPHSR